MRPKSDIATHDQEDSRSNLIIDPRDLQMEETIHKEPHKDRNLAADQNIFVPNRTTNAFNQDYFDETARQPPDQFRVFNSRQEMREE